MIPTLTVLKHLVVPEPPQPDHSELEHAHWDRRERAWRTHAETEMEQPAEVA